VQWLDGADGPDVGRRFLGRSAHKDLGEWQTISHVVECEPKRVFAWAVEDVDNPSSIWRFTLRPHDGGTLIEQWAQMGPARSGLSFAIDAMPEKEAKIVFVRLREWQAAMTANLAAVKALAEGAA
jgi:hypothetical protein